MLTDATTTVDGRGAHPPGLWLSVSALAKLRGVTKQAISKNIERWAAGGQQIGTRREGRALMVNVAEYDTARAEVGDAVHVLIEANKRGMLADATDPILAREQARNAAYSADLKKLELDKQLGRLIEVDALERAAVDCAEAMVRVIDQMATRAEEIAAAVAKDGVAGARTALRSIAKDMRSRAAEEFGKLPTLAMSPATGDTESSQA